MSDSFYGGQPGQSFVIKGAYQSVADMETDFRNGTNAKVWYGDFCIIDTPNKNDPDNGKIFKRSTMSNGDVNGAEYFGQIVGPASGLPWMQVTTLSDVRKQVSRQLVTANNEERKYPKAMTDASFAGPSDDYVHTDYDNDDPAEDLSVGEFRPAIATPDGGSPSLVPGKYVDGDSTKYNDSIKWSWVNISSKDMDNRSWFYVGFEIPYLVVDAEATSVSPYDEKTGTIADDWNVNVGRVWSDDEEDGAKPHPYYEKFRFDIPKGVKGDSFRNLRVVPFNDATVVYDVNDVIPVEGTSAFVLKDDATPMKPPTQHVGTITVRGKDVETKEKSDPLILVCDLYIYDSRKDGKTASDNGTMTPITIYLGPFDGLRTVATEDSLEESDLPITVGADGTLTFNYTYSPQEIYHKLVRWVDSVTIGSDDGTFSMKFNDGTSYSAQLDWVDDVTIAKDGTIRLHHVDVNADGTDAEGYETLDTKLENVTNVFVGSTGVLYLKYNTGKVVAAESLSSETEADLSSKADRNKTSDDAQPYHIKMITDIALNPWDVSKTITGADGPVNSLNLPHKITVGYNTQLEREEIGSPINSVQEIFLNDADGHLYALYSDSTARLSLPEYVRSNNVAPQALVGQDVIVDNGRRWVTYAKVVKGASGAPRNRTDNGTESTSGMNTIFWEDLGNARDNGNMLYGHRYVYHATNNTADEKDLSEYLKKNNKQMTATNIAETMVAFLNETYPREFEDNELYKGRFVQCIYIGTDDDGNRVQTFLFSWDQDESGTGTGTWQSCGSIQNEGKGAWDAAYIDVSDLPTSSGYPTSLSSSAATLSGSGLGFVRRSMTPNAKLATPWK